MKHLLAALFSIFFLANATLAVELNKIQAGKVASVVGRILEQAHYRQTPLDDKMSGQILTNYLNSLDYNHMIFLQSDVDKFTQKYGKDLDNTVLDGYIMPAFEIFNLYLERLSERNTLVQKLIKQEFNFTQDESFTAARSKLPWPKDGAEAAQLWRQRIKLGLLQSKLAKEKQDDAAGVIGRRYQRLENTMKQFESEDIVDLYLSAVGNAFDPHTDYMSPSEAKNFDIHNISLKLTGIGAQLQWEDGYTKIKDLVPGGPAELGKQLKPNDKIIAVAQGDKEPVDVIEMPLKKVVDMIRGPANTEVRLTVIPAKSPETKKVITIIRNEVPLKEQFAKARIYDISDEKGAVHRVGVINLPQFYDHCTEHVEVLIERLKKEKVHAIALDLRRNGGGILSEAVDLTGLFIKQGPVVQVKEPKRKAHVLEDKDSKVAYEGPLAVLVSKLSASASEIVAAALQDYGRAVVIGDQTTHGKGTVQQVISLSNFIDGKAVPEPGQIKLTVQKFYRIAGGTTQKEGVTPDIVLPSIYDYLEIGEGSLENALPADRTEPAKYKTLDQVNSYLPELKKRSMDRTADDKDFAYLREDIDKVKKRQEDKSISLNEEKRLAEKKEDKDRTDARKKERASRSALGEKIYELSLEGAEKDQPLELFDPEKLKAKLDEEANKATATAEGDEAEIDMENEPVIDPQLHESLKILLDYTQMLDLKNNVAKAPAPAVVEAK
ncbi:MAG: carboxy terminal-processing peptidase [Verrucomicrobiales bacterium]